MRLEKTKITFVLPSFAGGGAERVTIALCSRLNADAFAPSIVVLEDSGPWRSLVPNRIPIESLNRPRLRYALWSLRRKLLELRPDVVMSTPGYLNLGLMLLRPVLPSTIRFILREANVVSRNTSGSKGWFLRRAYRRLYKRADQVISPSSQIAHDLTANLGVPERLVSILYNPVEEERIREAALPTNRVSGPGPRFVAVGRLTAQKGLDRLLTAFAGCSPHVSLTILGEGSARRELEELRTTLALERNVAFKGFEHNAPSWLAGADALLLPSRWEGMPNVALEALACGTPVIAAPEAGAIHEIRAMTTPGAVTIDSFAPGLEDRLAHVPSNSAAKLRSTMLPTEFLAAHVGERFERLLRSLSYTPIQYHVT